MRPKGLFLDPLNCLLNPNSLYNLPWSALFPKLIDTHLLLNPFSGLIVVASADFLSFYWSTFLFYLLIFFSFFLCFTLLFFTFFLPTLFSFFFCLFPIFLSHFWLYLSSSSFSLFLLLSCFLLLTMSFNPFFSFWVVFTNPKQRISPFVWLFPPASITPDVFLIKSLY